MSNETARKLMIENLRDSLRLVRHLMKFRVEEFAEATGIKPQIIKNLEMKKIKMSVSQYIVVAALIDTYFTQNNEQLTSLKAILDSDGKNYGEEYETAFRDNSLLKRWFENFIDFADNVFLHVLIKKRMQYDMLLITQDKGLAGEAIKIGKNNRVVHGVKKILVQHIDKNGFLEKIFVIKEIKNTSTVKNSPKKISPDECFAIAKKIVKITGNLPVSEVPKVGDYVTAKLNGKKKTLQLLEEVGAGGEGVIYKTDFDGFVAKIYKPEKITRLRYEKLKLMLTKKIKYKGICFPIDLLYNSHKEFVGYLMRSASGHDLGKSVFMPMLLKKYFPTWNKADTVQLCVTILKKIKYLHDRNVILGDINPHNILVVSPTEVYFVDTDSWQVEGFICPVGMTLFTAPELQNKKEYGLRTFGNENFAVATLLFMIMHPGKPPYAMQDGEGIKENIINGEFSYPLGERKTGKVPKGPWRYCWSHLTYQIKETFYYTFRRGERYYSENKRPGTGHWLRLFKIYLDFLKSGKMSEQDDEALEIFPTGFKGDNKGDKNKQKKQHKRCARCGKPLFSKNDTICSECLKKDKVWAWCKCRYCGRDFSITEYEKESCENLGLPLQKSLCKDCR